MRTPDERETRRRAWVEEYSDFHNHAWLDSLTYAELLCYVNSRRLDAPTLPLNG